MPWLMILRGICHSPKGNVFEDHTDVFRMELIVLCSKTVSRVYSCIGLWVWVEGIKGGVTPQELP